MRTGAFAAAALTGAFITTGLYFNYNSVTNSSLLAAVTSCACSNNSVVVGGSFNNICYTNPYSVIIGGYSNNIINSFGCRNVIIGGTSNSFGSSICDSVILGGNALQANCCQTAYAQNFCACGSYFGNASGLTNLPTGGLTGVFLLLNNTGNFASSGHTHINYVSTGSTGIFITTGQTGAFGGTGSINTGSFVTTGQTGNFFAVGTVGNVCLSKTTHTIGTYAACSAILGGCTNTVNGTLSVVIGSLNSSAGDILSWNNVIIGGNSNSNVGCHNTVIAGALNSAGSTATHAALLGGRSNNLNGNLNTIVGGCSNTIASTAIASTIEASCSSTMSGCNSAIIGGYSNSLNGNNSVILAAVSLTTTGNSIVYAPNYCATGSFYGNASGLTGYLNTINTVAAPTSLVASHYNAIIRWTSTSSGVLAIPSGLTSYPIGGQTMLAQIGTGQAVISGCAGVTVLSASSKCKTSSTNSIISIIKTSDNEYLLGGDLV